MTAHRRALYTAGQVREIDRRAIDEHALPAIELMRRAGRAAFGCLRERWPGARSVGVLCGAGNNGGDGYVLARLALEAGFEVELAALAAPATLHGAAAEAHAEFVAAGGVVGDVAAADLPAGDVLVDAIFGTGLSRPVEGAARLTIDACNASGRALLALDLPSGLHPDDGRVLGAAIRADCTVAFIGRKIGSWVGAGPDHCGEQRFDDLGVPVAVYAGLVPSASLIDPAELRSLLPRRRRAAHKGEHGHVLLIGGGPGMPGAARLAGEAALRSGAGLVTVLAHPDSLAAIAAGRPELICRALLGTESILESAPRADLVALGPGLGQDLWAAEAFEAALALDRPLVLDADALNLLARAPRPVPRAILTPHPGEAARLLGSDTATVQADRLGAARALHERYAATVVLKGAGTVVHARGASPAICDRGNPGMAVAGMGDVLTGVIAALLAQGVPAAAAARAGVWLHAAAGDRASLAGERGLIASDLFEGLRSLVNPRGD
jgi:NAD(P)H-hydrate epimerase